MAKPMKSEVGESRKARIAALVAAGLDNDAIWAAMQHVYPQTIADDTLREAICKSKQLAIMPYDGDERQRLGWAIHQVKGLMVKEDKELDAELDVAAVGDTQSPDDVEFTNRERFQCGIPALDFIYGHTIYRWTIDADNSKYKLVNGRKVWIAGDYRKGDMVHINAGPGQWTTDDKKLAKTTHGMPEAFLSLWGGSPGVGKTKLAVVLTKALNALGHKTLYFNGEEDAQDFRIRLGGDVDNDLFRFSSGPLIRTEAAISKIYKERPKLVVFDSFQMLAEVKKGHRGANTALSRFRVLKNDEEAGRPHIIFISQLNKQEELAGSRSIEHLVDFASMVTRIQGRTGAFLFDCPRKNRAGKTPNHAIFKHDGDFGVESLSTEFLKTPIHKLLQSTGLSVIDPPDEIEPEETGE
jgi:hypothetical protein